MDTRDHARELTRWLRAATYIDGQDPLSSLARWVDMVAGLNPIRVDWPSEWDMCSTPADGAIIETQELYQTAVTRLLYAGSALTTALCYVAPSTSRETTLLDRCTKTLSESAEVALLHETCAVSWTRTGHRRSNSLADCASATRGLDVVLAGVECLQNQVNAGFWIPEPESNGDDWIPGNTLGAEMIDGGATCLLMTVQRLLLLAFDNGLLVPAQSVWDLEEEGGAWIPTAGEMKWRETLDMREALTLMHLDLNTDPVLQPPITELL